MLMAIPVVFPLEKTGLLSFLGTSIRSPYPSCRGGLRRLRSASEVCASVCFSSTTTWPLSPSTRYNNQKKAERSSHPPSIGEAAGMSPGGSGILFPALVAFSWLIALARSNCNRSAPPKCLRTSAPEILCKSFTSKKNLRAAQAYQIPVSSSIFSSNFSSAEQSDRAYCVPLQWPADIVPTQTVTAPRNYAADPNTKELPEKKCNISYTFTKLMNVGPPSSPHFVLLFMFICLNVIPKLHKMPRYIRNYRSHDLNLRTKATPSITTSGREHYRYTTTPTQLNTGGSVLLLPPPLTEVSCHGIRGCEFRSINGRLLCRSPFSRELGYPLGERPTQRKMTKHVTLRSAYYDSHPTPPRFLMPPNPYQIYHEHPRNLLCMD